MPLRLEEAPKSTGLPWAGGNQQCWADQRKLYQKELDKKYKFRLVEAEMLVFEEDKNIINEKQKNNLLDKYSQYIKVKKINLNLEEIQNIDFNQIIKFIAMISPFSDIEKQVLLETKNLSDFYKKLHSILVLEIVEDNNSKTIN